MYTGDKYRHCYNRSCRKKTRWVRCPNCNGRGPTWTTTGRNNCDYGYKGENGTNDSYH